MGKTVISKCGSGKRFVAALALVVVLCGMDGVQGIGTLKAEAALSFPERVEVGERISLTYESGDVAKCDGCHVVFCDSEETAQQALDSVNSPSQTGNLNGYGEVGSEELDGSEPFSYYISVPDNMNYGSDSYSVDAWVRKDSKTVVDTDTGRYCYVAAYYAKLPIIINYDQNYQTTPGYYDSPLMYNLSASFSSPDAKVDVTLLDSLEEREGYELLGWSTDENATTPEYAPGAVYQMGVDERNLLLYAVWKRKPITVDLIYGPNGGEGDYITQTKTVTLTGGSDTAEVELLSAADFTRTNYKLTGWLINEDEYGLGDSFSFHVNEGTTYDRFSLGAVWTPKTTSSISINVADKVYDNDDIADKIDIHPSRTGTVTLEYKAADQEDSGYTSTAPSSPGDYIVRATLEENDDYMSAFDIAPLRVLSSKQDVSVTYEPGAGNGTTVRKDIEVTLSDGKGTLTLLSDADFDRPGYRLTGWSGGGKNYDLGAEVDVDVDTDSLAFEAVWIAKKQATLSLDVDSPVKYGKDTADYISFSTDSDGKVKLEYKKSGTPDSTYSEAIPSEVGKYVVRATVPETDEYLGTSDAKNFEIALIQADTEIKLSIKTPIYYGTDVASAITCTTNSDGKILLEYKKSGEADSTYSETAPRDAGKYVVRASVEATADYKAASAEKTFEIISNQKEAEITIDIKTPVYYGTDIKKVVSYETESNGDVTVEYKKKGSKDDTYSKTVPKDIGKYVVRVSTESTADYKAAVKEKNFEIVFLPAPDPAYTYEEIKDTTGAITDLYIVPVDGYSIALSTDVPYGSKALYTAAIKAGVVYLQRDKDGAKTDGIKLAEYHLEDSIKLEVPTKVYYGLELKVTTSSLSPAEKKLEYKKLGAPDDAYSESVPTMPGDYVVRFSAPAAGLFAAVNETRNFSIVYLEEPSSKAYVDGTKNGEWLIANVKINAPEGYLISTTMGSGYKESLSWDDDISSLYYRRSDGAMTDAVVFDPDVKIDMKAPTVRFESGLGLSNPQGTVGLTQNRVTFTLEDDNLASVTVNGSPYTVSNKRCEVTLEAGMEKTQWVVVATDKAGNSYTFTIELSAKWMVDGVMPVGILVTLKSDIPYFFESGNDYMVEGDDTVYIGGNQFYVKSDMSCTFRLKEETE